MVKHLAIFNVGDAAKIFSGKRKIEGRFSQIKIPPFAKVSKGDIVLVKVGGEKITGQFIVDRVLYFDHPRQEEFNQIKRKYGKDLSLSATFWLDKEKVNYVTLMFVKSVTKFIVAPQINKKDLRPWVVLE
ncbi:hypothetical protein A3D07_01010 [Candidatus Curtissbacteria bacterium RIFCSPHIGHO2_02_FULL_42_15]|uniref:ASCH domain-containing protein n=1 Tax=Candidatus Curtissbacteria bacterium RIFCSPHIGHO2_02_FULL_42_15 TaxID=1797716 RepID=A0A1F5GCT0_9BACT|nr:MAG: hypothetical protein A3D07_01010 [Candidatus Curtissbacteria bacterium RIFCSPHIGHO2_02_FULL_42_15]